MIKIKSIKVNRRIEGFMTHNVFTDREFEFLEEERGIRLLLSKGYELIPWGNIDSVIYVEQPDVAPAGIDSAGAGIRKQNKAKKKCT